MCANFIMKIPTLSPEDLKNINQAVQEISNELETIKTAKIQINEILKSIETKYKMPKKALRKVVMLYHKQQVLQFEEETKEIREVYNQIINIHKTRTS
jgi:ribosome maturation protein Sdo1